MIVSLDYDNTFTADPVAWRFVVAALNARGHAVICVTARNETPTNREVLKHELPNGVQVVFAGEQPKEVAAIKHGYLVDVWIDDRPDRIKSPGVRRSLGPSKPKLAGRYRR
jgi:hypothetical protein